MSRLDEHSELTRSPISLTNMGLSLLRSTEILLEITSMLRDFEWIISRDVRGYRISLLGYQSHVSCSRRSDLFHRLPIFMSALQWMAFQCWAHVQILQPVHTSTLLSEDDDPKSTPIWLKCGISRMSTNACSAPYLFMMPLLNPACMGCQEDVAGEIIRGVSRVVV